jgi:predicted metal-binding membrane protein
MVSGHTSEGTFFGVSASIFAASVAATLIGQGSMAAMGETPMPGGWTLSMAWQRMCGQTWSGSAATFLGMWIVMMVAMMLPSLLPMLWRYRQALDSAGRMRGGRLTALLGIGYFFVWTLFGVAAYPLGVAMVATEIQVPALARLVPALAGVVVLMAGALQFTAWKAHHLACCRHAASSSGALPEDAAMAWKRGLRCGLHCCFSCSGLAAVLLAIGVIDLRVMTVVTVAVTAERLAPAAAPVTRIIGIVALGIGMVLIARAGGLA